MKSRPLFFLEFPGLVEFDWERSLKDWSFKLTSLIESAPVFFFFFLLRFLRLFLPSSPPTEASSSCEPAESGAATTLLASRGSAVSSIDFMTTSAASVGCYYLAISYSIPASISAIWQSCSSWSSLLTESPAECSSCAAGGWNNKLDELSSSYLLSSAAAASLLLGGLAKFSAAVYATGPPPPLVFIFSSATVAIVL